MGTTAVAAVKAGAIDYMAKPVDADDVEAALLAAPDSKQNPQKILCQLIGSSGSISTGYLNYATEMSLRRRRLKMHRRTLQRILSKISPN